MQNGVGRRTVLRWASLYVCLTLLSGMAFPLSSSASPAIEIAQQNAKQITGTVSDAGGTPIIGANVVQAGTTNGTITDVDGKQPYQCQRHADPVLGRPGGIKENRP